MAKLRVSKKYLLVVVLLLGLAAWYYRQECLFWFQKYRLQAITCTSGNKDCRSKLWAHRVNSVERLDFLGPHFPGVEADVVYDSASHHYLVYHPPFNGRTLSLKVFLQKLKQWNKPAWIDLRYVTAHNYQQAFAAFEELDKPLNIKSQLFIELYNVEAANYFASKGYTVSLNIFNQLEPGPAWAHLASLVSPDVKYVSQEDHFLPFLKKYFPNKQYLVWSVAFRNYLSLHHLETLANDSSIAIILVNVKSRYRY